MRRTMPWKHRWCTQTTLNWVMRGLSFAPGEAGAPYSETCSLNESSVRPYVRTSVRPSVRPSVRRFSDFCEEKRCCGHSFLLPHTLEYSPDWKSVPKRWLHKIRKTPTKESSAGPLFWRTFLQVFWRNVFAKVKWKQNDQLAIMRFLRMISDSEMCCFFRKTSGNLLLISALRWSFGAHICAYLPLIYALKMIFLRGCEQLTQVIKPFAEPPWNQTPWNQTPQIAVLTLETP